jgi:hypothetical protein
MKLSSHRSRGPALALHPSLRVWLVVLTALLAFAVAVSARAQSAGGDPPSRVARLSEVAGQVWLYSPESNEWLAVERNRPLTTGDRIATDNGAHAEITLGSTTLRLDQRPRWKSSASTTPATTYDCKAAASRRGSAARRRWPSFRSTPTKDGFASRSSVASASTGSTRQATSR